MSHGASTSPSESPDSVVLVALVPLQVVPHVGAFRAPSGAPRAAPWLDSQSLLPISGAAPRHLWVRQSSDSADVRESLQLELERRSDPVRPPLGPAQGQAWPVSNSEEAVLHSGPAKRTLQAQVDRAAQVRSRRLGVSPQMPMGRRYPGRRCSAQVRPLAPVLVQHCGLPRPRRHESRRGSCSANHPIPAP